MGLQREAGPTVSRTTSRREVQVVRVFLEPQGERGNPVRKVQAHGPDLLDPKHTDDRRVTHTCSGGKPIDCLCPSVFPKTV